MNNTSSACLTTTTTTTDLEKMEVVWVIMKRKETMNLLARSHGQLTLAVKRMHVIIIVPQNKHHEMGAINEPSIIIPPTKIIVRCLSAPLPFFFHGSSM